MEKIDKQPDKRGFTTPEKWIIWSVFCLLLALSASRASVFVGLLLVSYGGVNLVKRTKVVVAILLCVAGLSCLVFSKFLI